MATRPVKPPRLLIASITAVAPESYFNYDDGSGDPYLGSFYRATYSITVTPTPHSSHIYKSYSGMSEYVGLDVEVGDWIATTDGARAMEIVEVITFNGENTLTVVLQDTGRYNTFHDPVSGEAHIPAGDGIIFEVDDNFVPLVHNLPSALPGQVGFTWAPQIQSRFANIRDRLGLHRRQVDHGFALGQALRVAAASEVQPTTSVGTVTNPTITQNETSRINETLIEWGSFSPTTTDEIVAFLNNLNIQNVTAANAGGAVQLTASDGRDIQIMDVIPGSNLTVNLGLRSSGNGVYEGKFVPASGNDVVAAYVAEMGISPDDFHFRWNGNVARSNAIGDLGDHLYLENGAYSINEIGPPAAVKVEAARPTVMRGKTGGGIDSSSTFVLNKTLISGVTTISSAVTAINDANIPNIVASDVENSLQITNTSGEKIVIWDDIAGDITSGFGIPPFAKGVEDDLLVLLQSVSTTIASGTPVNQYTLHPDDTQQFALADGAITGDSTLPNPGEDITTIIYHGYRAPTNFRTKTISGFTPARQGTLLAIQNDQVVGSRVLSSGGSNVGTYGSLVIDSDDGIFMTAHVEGIADPGLNIVQIDHGRYGSTNLARFVYDDIDQTPSASGVTLDEVTVTNLTYSSGIPHYGEGSQLEVQATLAGLAKYTFIRDNIAEVSIPPALVETVNVGQSNLPAILPFDAAPQTLIHTIDVDGIMAARGPLLVRAQNAIGWGEAGTPPVYVNILSGSDTPDGPDDPVREMHIYVDPSLGEVITGAAAVAERIATSAGDTPNDDLTALMGGNWNSAAALAAHEAAVVGGRIRHDLTDYSSGWLPAGPNLSAQNAVQYFTVIFRRNAVAEFDIVIDDMASYSGCWVKLPGITDTTVSANGWWDMSVLFRQLGTPGDNLAAGGNGGNGCALNDPMTGFGGTFTCTFGQQNSSNSSNNIVAVRFRLDTGQQIANLAFMESA